MTAGVTIRRATADDAAALAAIGTASFRDAYGGTAPVAELESHLRTHFGVDAVGRELQSASLYVLALLDGEAAAFAKLREQPPALELPVRRAVELQQVYVLPAHQRTGLGGRLIEAAAGHARELGADGLWLSVWEDAPWAVNAYRKHGFDIAGTVDFRLGNTVYRDYLMWRRP
jgi:ribosomal protein S18 acetylase RimI-like enzyme